MTEKTIEILKKRGCYYMAFDYKELINEIENQFIKETKTQAIEVMRCCVSDDCKEAKALEEKNEQRKENFNEEDSSLFCEDCQKWVEKQSLVETKSLLEMKLRKKQ